MEIKSLASTDFDTLFRAFSLAFADYELQQDKQELSRMLERRGFNPSLSFAAFEYGEIVAFTLNGTGTTGGLPTAYDTGTGTLPSHRGQGLAAKIFRHSLPCLSQAGIRRYLLEVLQHNSSAVSVYRKLGFSVTREFYYFRQKNHDIKNLPASAHPSFIIRPASLEELADTASFRDFEPSWQNSFESVLRSEGEFLTLGAFRGNNMAGYCIFESCSGDITQIAVGNEHRRIGIGSALLKEVIDRNCHESIKIINTETGCTSITKFLESRNIHPAGKQFEMMMEI